MKTPTLRRLLPLIVLFICSQPVVARTPAAPAAVAGSPTVAGWDDFVDNLRTLPARLLATLPQALQDDPQVRQEVGRLALEAFASSSLDAISGDGDHPVFLALSNETLNIAQPNADTIYRSARITPGGVYRLRGLRGAARIVKIGQSAPNLGEGGTAAKQVGGMLAYDDVNTLHVDANGRFDVILSPRRPAGYAGDWWRLDPGANKLLLRLVASDWIGEKDPTISIERIDIPARRSRASAQVLEQRLRRLPVATSAIALLLVDHVEQLRRQGYVNKLKVFDVSQLGGLAGQSYYEGAYDLGDDEALIVEAKVPAGCLYRSMILTNEIYETTDWINNESSLNDAQSAPDKDGVLRVVVSSRDPGVPNWLDTAGYAHGLIQGRWNGCETQPIPSVRKVALADVREMLPPETPVVSPAEREQRMRSRLEAYQQRPLW